MTRDEVILLDLIRAARLIIEFNNNLAWPDFQKDIRTQSASLHQLMIMGEATKRLSPEYRDQTPDVPWKQMAGMRDKLIHGYDIVDLERVWETITVHVPQVLAQIEPLLPPHSS